MIPRTMPPHTMVREAGLDSMPRTAAQRLPLVLIVEDDADTLVDLRLRLLASGYRTRYATTAFAAVRRIRLEKPDLLLLDLALPDDGCQTVLESLKRLPANLRMPVITLDSSRQERPVHVPATELVTRHLRKLRNSETLLRAVEEALFPQ